MSSATIGASVHPRFQPNHAAVFVVQHQVLTKRVPLTISRGTSACTDVFWLRWQEEAVEGWGEMVPVMIDERPQTVGVLREAAIDARMLLAGHSAWDRARIDQTLRAAGSPSALVAAINLALYDWMGKRLGQPVWRLLGLGEVGLPPTSVTIGIGSPAAAAERVRQWLQLGDFRAFKVKLGSPAGIAADKAMFAAAVAAMPAGTRLSVDANGGWELDDAIEMARWLAGLGVDHLEQPLARGREPLLPALRAASPLPVFVDESCRSVEELVRLVGSIDGINIKLMKCGGIDGALRLITVARAHGLKLLLGCYGHTSLANTAAAHLGSLVDHLDLDSHLNLTHDPFCGAQLRAGRLVLSREPGFGVTK